MRLLRLLLLLLRLLLSVMHGGSIRLLRKLRLGSRGPRGLACCLLLLGVLLRLLLLRGGPRCMLGLLLRLVGGLHAGA